jgi:hypothetical protein
MALTGMMTRPSGSYRDQLVAASIDLANVLSSGYSGGYRHTPPSDREECAGVANEIFARFHEQSPRFGAADHAGLIRLAEGLQGVFLHLADGDVAGAVPIVNVLLQEFPTSPHLSSSAPWSFHYHDHSMPPVAGWQVGCAAALGSFISSAAWQYIGRCGATSCDRVFLDDTKNGSRRFCTPRCQNRAKVRAFRLRTKR